MPHFWVASTWNYRQKIKWTFTSMFGLFSVQGWMTGELPVYRQNGSNWRQNNREDDVLTIATFLSCCGLTLFSSNSLKPAWLMQQNVPCECTVRCAFRLKTAVNPQTTVFTIETEHNAFFMWAIKTLLFGDKLPRTNPQDCDRRVAKLPQNILRTNIRPHCDISVLKQLRKLR